MVVTAFAVDVAVGDLFLAGVREVLKLQRSLDAHVLQVGHQSGVEPGKEMPKAAVKGGQSFDASTDDLIKRAFG